MRTRSGAAVTRLTEGALTPNDDGVTAPRMEPESLQAAGELTEKMSEVVSGGELNDTTEDYESKDEEADEDALLNIVAAAFERRLGTMDGASEPSGSAAAAAESATAAGGRENEGTTAGGGGRNDFLCLDDVGGVGISPPPPVDPFTPEDLTWVPQTGLPMGDDPSPAAKPPPGSTAIGPIVDPRVVARHNRLVPKNAGPKWFDLPATQITPELKQELRLLKLRGALDPKRHYKAPDTTKFPKHFQMGTVVESAAEFYGGRLTNRERKQTFGQELLADPTLKHYRKRKYTEIQAEKDLKSRRHFNKKKNRHTPLWGRG